MALFGFIGVGNMGYPLFQAAKKTFGHNEVIYTAATVKTRQTVMEKTGIPSMEDNILVAKDCKYLVLAIKPQYFSQVLKEIKEYITMDHVVISLAVGITIETIQGYLTQETRIVRAMPNTPANLGLGMTGVTYRASEFSSEEQGILDRFFTSFGKYEIFDEGLMNAVTCASGSSPAYVYQFIEALADSVVKYGIPRSKAYTLVAQTVLGAAAMVLETGEHPAKLKDDVCSPGGTTIAGVSALEEYGFRNAIIQATDACYKKSQCFNDK